MIERPSCSLWSHCNGQSISIMLGSISEKQLSCFNACRTTLAHLLLPTLFRKVQLSAKRQTCDDYLNQCSIANDYQLISQCKRNNCLSGWKFPNEPFQFSYLTQRIDYHCNGSNPLICLNSSLVFVRQTADYSTKAIDKLRHINCSNKRLHIGWPCFDHANYKAKNW